MDILMSLHKKWADKIFDGSKTLEFRKKIGKDFKVGDIVYIYETGKNGGKKQVVGDFTIKSIVRIDQSSGCGTYDLLPYYCENIIRDFEALEAVKKAYAIELPNYKDSIKLSYIYNINFLESLRDTDNFPFLLNLSREEQRAYYDGQEKTKKLIDSCEDWLRDIGYYNEFEETYYNYYLEIENVHKYDMSLNLNAFLNKEKEPIITAPQSWCYCKKA